MESCSSSIWAYQSPGGFGGAGRCKCRRVDAGTATKDWGHVPNSSLLQVLVILELFNERPGDMQEACAAAPKIYTSVNFEVGIGTSQNQKHAGLRTGGS